MFEEMIRELKKLKGATIQIVASGVYPTKQRTKVSHVAHYQNDGTDRIEAANFVEKSAKKNRYWEKETFKAIADFIDGNHYSLEQVGLRIAYDINNAVNRIKTGRLKHSMLPKIKLEK